MACCLCPRRVAVGVGNVDSPALAIRWAVEAAVGPESDARERPPHDKRKHSHPSRLVPVCIAERHGTLPFISACFVTQQAQCELSCNPGRACPMGAGLKRAFPDCRPLRAVATSS